MPAERPRPARVVIAGVGYLDCACGCGERLAECDKQGRPRRYLNGHNVKSPQGGKLADPEWRRARAVKAGAATQATYARRRQERGEQFETKGLAYDAGYRRGYQAAYAYWQREFERGAPE